MLTPQNNTCIYPKGRPPRMRRRI